MVYGVILASGVGSRMKSDTPKQFLEIEEIPIVVYTISSMLRVERIDQIVLVCHPDYIDYAETLLNTYFNMNDRNKIKVVSGGKERIDSIDNAVIAVTKGRNVEPEDVIIFHDAVRPFVSKNILEDSIEGALEKGATVAGIPAVDTMLYSEDGKRVDDIPDRSKLYNGQAPDTFRLEFFLSLRENISEEEKTKVFGTSKICELNNEPIHIIPGDEMNFKITTPRDLKKAEFYLSLLREEDNESFRFAGNR